jgi:uncharacterized hydrophobic protein (TIGR00271 family)
LSGRFRIGSIARSARRFLRRRLALRAGTDAAGTIRRVADDAVLSAENLWLLGCSAILASIGLDVGSAAVVIGAMLISPLMGPILGTGLALGITDRALLQRSLRELGFATVLVLIVSTLYFRLSPLASPTTELIARTRPTLLDVGVAFFGGIAGIVAGSRMRPSMAIPGVAIATALMPPLCTAGFGIATGNGGFFVGAFYLFVLNAVFIALATFVTVRMLRFPHHEEATEDDRRRERRLVAIVTIAAALPSAYFLYDVAIRVREQRRIGQFIEREVEARGCAVPQWELETRDPGIGGFLPTAAGGQPKQVLRIYVAGHPIGPASADSLRAALPRYALRGLELQVIQSEVSAENLRRFQGDVRRDIVRVVAAAFAARDSSDGARPQAGDDRRAAAAHELVKAFPEVVSVTYVPRGDLLSADSTATRPSVLLAFRSRTRPRERAEILGRARALLRERLEAEDLEVEAR